MTAATQYLNLAAIAPLRGQVAGARFVDAEWAYFGGEKRCSGSGGAMIGDQRVSYHVLRAGDIVTVFGKYEAGHFGPFRNQVLLARGKRDALVSQMRQERSSQNWIYRIAGGFLLWIALYLIISPSLALVTWIPIIGTLVSAAATMVTMIVALALTGAVVFLGWGMAFFTRLFGGLIA
jgi:hypothetical protein